MQRFAWRALVAGAKFAFLLKLALNGNGFPVVRQAMPCRWGSSIACWKSTAVPECWARRVVRLGDCVWGSGGDTIGRT